MIPDKRQVEEYVGETGVSHFRAWFEALPPRERAKISIAISRVEEGNDGAIKSVGDGVCEIKVDWGPGYRVYFGFDGFTLIILLAGETKKRQDRDIVDAKAMWQNYKRRKKGN